MQFCTPVWISIFINQRVCFKESIEVLCILGFALKFSLLFMAQSRILLFSCFLKIWSIYRVVCSLSGLANSDASQSSLTLWRCGIVCNILKISSLWNELWKKNTKFAEKCRWETRRVAAWNFGSQRNWKWEQSAFMRSAARKLGSFSACCEVVLSELRKLFTVGVAEVCY